MFSATSVESYFSDSDSDNSADEEALLQIRRERRHIREHSNPLEMNASLFTTNFRLSKEAFVDLLNKIDAKLTKGTRRTSIPNILKLCMTMRFCAQGSYQLNIGNEGIFGLAQPTVSLILKEVVDVLEQNICPEYIKFEYSDMEIQAAKLYFYERSGIPGIIGCIDGTHIKIVAPEKRLQHLYYNRKGFHSINAMIVCDHKMSIRFVNAKYPGSLHDAMVFQMSSLHHYLERNRNSWLLGDAGYSLMPYLKTPYRNVESGSPQSLYNERHIKARNIVERTIGLLKSRFRCLLGAKALHYAPKKATQLVNVCVALHNICIARNLNGIDEEEMADNDWSEVLEANWSNDSHNSEAENIRNTILTSLSSYV